MKAIDGLRSTEGEEDISTISMLALDGSEMLD